MGGIGVTELILILVIILIVFGVGKLPEIGKALGKGLKEFKDASQENEPPLIQGKDKSHDKPEEDS